MRLISYSLVTSGPLGNAGGPGGDPFGCVLANGPRGR